MPRGQIKKRGKTSYLVRIFLGRDENGKQQFHTHTVRGKREDAESYLTEKLRELDLCIFVEPSKMLLKAYFDKWLSTVAKQRVREATFTSYEYHLEKYVEPTLGKRKLADIKPLDIQNLYANMQKQGIGARTVRYVHSIMSSAFKQAVKWNMLSRNPCDSVDLPRMVRREMLAFSKEEAAKFVKAAKDDLCGIVLIFGLITGMRPSEYLSVKWSDIDFETGNVSVQRTLVRRKGGGWYFGEPKTSRSRRSIPLPASLLQSLREHKRHQAERRLKLGAKWHNNDLVFCNDGKPLHHRNLAQRNFVSILKSAGLREDFRLYDLRHSCATLLLAAQENPKVVSERLGHADITLTLNVYSHVLPDMQQAATDKLEKMLYG